MIITVVAATVVVWWSSVIIVEIWSMGRVPTRLRLGTINIGMKRLLRSMSGLSKQPERDGSCQIIVLQEQAWSELEENSKRLMMTDGSCDVVTIGT